MKTHLLFHVFVLLFLRLASASAQGIGLITPDDERAGIAGAGTSASSYAIEMTPAVFTSRDAAERRAGRQLVDIEVRPEGTSERYGGIWFPVTGTVHRLIQGSTDDWSDFLDDMRPLSGRYLDIEVDYFSGVKKYSALFLEDGDNYGYAIYSTNTDDRFQERLEEQQAAGRSIIDFESYIDNGGNVRYAGVWVNDEKQPNTTLYYGLESADVSDLLRPLTGRLIDFERYFSPVHDEFRYAVILAQYRGGGWGLWRSATSASLAQQHVAVSDSNTHIIDLESWPTSSGTRHAGVWGDTFKSLHEVTPISTDDRRVPMPANAQAFITALEGGGNNFSARLGFYARNIRTHQAIGHRENQPFYLASTTKTAILVKFLREVQAGRLDLDESLQYTLNTGTPEPWFVDDRCDNFGRETIGLSSGGSCRNCGDSSDFGQSFPVDALARAMMTISDNAATTMLVDHPEFGLSFAAEDLNEWLGGLSGVAQGFGLVTSIHDVDRTILWQAQVMDRPDETSFFRIPGWKFEPWMRGCGDNWGDLRDAMGGSLPSNSRTEGYNRYYRQGLNSATPRAFGRFLERLTEETLLDDDHTELAFDMMNEGNWFRAVIPGHVTVRGKGGTKSRTFNDTAVLRCGPDAVVIGVYTMDNTNLPTNYRGTLVRGVATALFQALFPDARLTTQFRSPSVALDERLDLEFRIRNAGGGDIPVRFPVRTWITTSARGDLDDAILLDEHDHRPLGGGADAGPVVKNLPLPRGLEPGTYYVVVEADPTSSGRPFGLVGEINESNNISIAGRVDVTPASSVEVFLRGDTDASGNVDLTDGISTLTHLFQGRGELGCPDAADFNDDSVVDVSDAVSVFSYLFLGGTPPSPPGDRTCGPDPSEDALEPCARTASRCS
ncbi:MAG: serine hydrolase [Planctomycetota bacterium]